MKITQTHISVISFCGLFCYLFSYFIFDITLANRQNTNIKKFVKISTNFQIVAFHLQMMAIMKCRCATIQKLVEILTNFLKYFMLMIKIDYEMNMDRLEWGIPKTSWNVPCS